MSTSVNESTLSSDFGRYVRYHLRGRRSLAAAVLLAAPALWFGWPWLVAAGLAPFIVAMAPCAVMGAVGACSMGKSCKRSEADSSAPPETGASFGPAPAAPKPLTSSEATNV